MFEQQAVWSSSDLSTCREPCSSTRLMKAAPPVRESLRRLEAIGVVEIRHGSGVYVRTGGDRVLVANPYSGRLEARMILELLDARLLIEPTLAERTALNASDDEIEELGEV